MVKWMRIAVGALALLVVAATASGDSNTYNYQDNGTAKFNTRSGQIVDAYGNAKVVDATPPVSFGQTRLLMDGVTIGAASSDSCVAQTFYGRIQSVTIKCVGINTTATSTTQLAVSIRKHVNGLTDTLNVSNFQRAGNVPATTDTAQVGQFVLGTATTSGSGEFTVRFLQGRTGSANNAVGGYPSPQTFMMQALYGSPLFTEYGSIRIRNLAAYNVQVWLWVTEVPL